jgi:hypothetical protein
MSDSKTLKELNSDFNDFDEFVRDHVSKQTDDKDIIEAMKAKWFDLFDDSLEDETAQGLLGHYREMGKKQSGGKYKNMKRTKRSLKVRKQKGGMAPIGATMGPGFPLMQTYGSFPSDITSTPSMAKALDIIGGNPGMSSSCGKEESLWPTPGPSMGSDKVGGGRRTKKNRSKKLSNRSDQTGGGLLDALRPLSTNPPGILQQAYTTVAGVAQPPSADPIDQAWKYSSASGSLLNPSITKIGSDINQLATPAPWGKS